MPKHLSPSSSQLVPCQGLLASLLCVAALFAAGCAKGDNLLAEDQERIEQAAAEPAAGEAAPQAAAPTTRPADLERSPLLTFDLRGEDVSPSGIELREGLYTFRIVNNDPLPRYFWLRKSNGGANGDTVVLLQLPDDETVEHPVLVAPGDYLFSSPMPPDAKTYNLRVR